MKWATGKLYCNTVIILQLGSVGLARIVLQYKYCIAGWEAGLSVSQYTGLYCGLNGCRRPNCIAIQNCIMTGGMGAGQALGASARRAGRWASGRKVLTLGTGRHVGRRARGERAAGGRGASARQASGSGARA